MVGDAWGLHLDPSVVAALREQLNTVAEDAVTAIIAEVPSYRRAFAGQMGATIQGAVKLALGGFLDLAAVSGPADAQAPIEPVIEGAYALGRGEARSGRTMDALLAAYRVGARVCWRGLSQRSVEAGLEADQVAHFAERVFAYIDQLSAASVSGHADELETTGRVRQRLLERLSRQLLAGRSPDSLVAAAERAGWAPVETLTAVLMPTNQLRGALASLSDQTLVLSDDVPGLDAEDLSALLVPDASRPVLVRSLGGRHAVIGPSRPWLRAISSFARAVRTLALVSKDGHGAVGADGAVVDADDHLSRLVLDADPEALADLRIRAFAPMAGLRPATAEKLRETLRAWLLCRGRREAVAALLHVHPQTVRYRMTQLREVYGDRFDDPEVVLELTLALG